MKGIFFSQINADAAYQGAVVKVFDEIKAFENRGYKMRHVNATPVSKGLRKTHIGKGICAAIPFTYIFSRYKYEPSYDECDFFYFRFEAADYWLIRFFRIIRKRNPNALIIVELPNFPSNVWMVMPWCFPLLIKDAVARRKYKKYIDRFVVLDPEYEQIYGVPTLQYLNGIDVSRVPVRVPDCKADTNRIDIIGVATMFPSHGFDRLISAIYEYYKNDGDRNIVFHVVGEGPGPELKKYKGMVEQYQLWDHVKFEGTLFGEKLFACYNACDIAIDDLAGYRMGLEVSSSLKSREYLSCGLPIVAGCDIDILMCKDFGYFLRIENNDSPIDMNLIIAFYDRVYSNESVKSVIQNIRKFAEENCTYESTLRNVFRYISSAKGLNK